ncbi:hypothetical protein AGDE_00575 [Angomonas deanei]|nr:hypothetical protein AGDE_00575 [Angomonas deanei]|eukprot:EPY43346.1 hypothetical protein AGDE_00575 [Angomonas deanei]
MMASNGYPHRLGSCVLMDTPLVTKEMIDNAAAREEVAAAEKNVNVPAAEMEFAKSSLTESLEGTLPCPAKEDLTVYEKNIFDPKHIFERGGLVRRDDRYLSVQQVGNIFHPLQLILPSKDAVCDAGVHKDFLRIRRPAVIKSASSHEALFGAAASSEVADVIRAWLNRFEPDVVLKRRYEQAAKEMSQLMGGSQTVASPAGQTTKTEGKKKKEKKKQ